MRSNQLSYPANAMAFKKAVQKYGVFFICATFFPLF